MTKEPCPGLIKDTDFVLVKFIVRVKERNKFGDKEVVKKGWVYRTLQFNELTRIACVKMLYINPYSSDTKMDEYIIYKYNRKYIIHDVLRDSYEEFDKAHIINHYIVTGFNRCDSPDKKNLINEFGLIHFREEEDYGTVLQ